MPLRTGLVTASLLNVRPEPSTRRPPVGQLERGTVVQILSRHGGWYRIQHRALEGFVHGDFLRLVESEPAAGYLHEREDVKTAALEPAPEEQKAVRADLPALQRAARRTWNRYGGLLGILCDATGVEPGAAVAVLLVESSGSGFGPDGRMIIRFENHTFGREWGEAGRDRFAACFRFDARRPWTNHEYRPGLAGPWIRCHTSQALEWDVLTFARSLHEVAALRSISMGLPQIMGFNHARIGYDSVRTMFDRFSSDVRYQLVGLFDFIKGPGTISPMLEALQRGKFGLFASFYNGPGQAARYEHRLGRAYEAFTSP